MAEEFSLDCPGRHRGCEAVVSRTPIGDWNSWVDDAVRVMHAVTPCCPRCGLPPRPKIRGRGMLVLDCPNRHLPADGVTGCDSAVMAKRLWLDYVVGYERAGLRLAELSRMLRREEDHDESHA